MKNPKHEKPNDPRCGHSWKGRISHTCSRPEGHATWHICACGAVADS